MKKKDYLTYESPEITVVENSVEGMLCQSMKDNSYEDWGEEDLW
jgi:hypothetical protein